MSWTRTGGCYVTARDHADLSAPKAVSATARFGLPLAAVAMTIESTRIATHAATLWCRRAHLALLEVPECTKWRLDFDDDRDGIACMGSLRAARSALVDYALVRFVLIHRAVETVVYRLPSHRRACRHICRCSWTGHSHGAWSPLVEDQVVVTGEPQHVCPSRVHDRRTLQCGLDHVRDGHYHRTSKLRMAHLPRPRLLQQVGQRRERFVLPQCPSVRFAWSRYRYR